MKAKGYCLECDKEIEVNITHNIGNYFSKVLYIDSESDAIWQEIASNLGRYAERVQLACYGECERNLPEKDCSENIVVWRDSIESVVYQQENCVIIEGDLMAVDAFLYRVLGIN